MPRPNRNCTRREKQELFFLRSYGTCRQATAEHLPVAAREAGGQGLLRATPSGEHNVAGMLIIRQTPAVHQQIRKLLHDMRALSTSQGGFGGGGQGGGGGFF